VQPQAEVGIRKNRAIITRPELIAILGVFGNGGKALGNCAEVERESDEMAFKGMYRTEDGEREAFGRNPCSFGAC
jgi:hypothetical protein